MRIMLATRNVRNLSTADPQISTIATLQLYFPTQTLPRVLLSIRTMSQRPRRTRSPPMVSISFVFKTTRPQHPLLDEISCRSANFVFTSGRRPLFTYITPFGRRYTYSMFTPELFKALPSSRDFDGANENDVEILRGSAPNRIPPQPKFRYNISIGFRRGRLPLTRGSS